MLAFRIESFWPLLYIWTNGVLWVNVRSTVLLLIYHYQCRSSSIILKVRNAYHLQLTLLFDLAIFIWSVLPHYSNPFYRVTLIAGEAPVYNSGLFQQVLNSRWIVFPSKIMMSWMFTLFIQDLPEFFEDNMVTWMNHFHTLLTTSNTLLTNQVCLMLY